MKRFGAGVAFLVLGLLVSPIQGQDDRPQDNLPASPEGKTWKLVWQATLPSKIELFDVVQDPSEKVNLAEANPQKVAELQRRIEALAREAVPPLLFNEALGTVRNVLFGSVALPEEERAMEDEP